VAAPEFFGCRGTARAPELDWGTFKKLCVLSLFLVEASSYTVRTNGSAHGRKIVFCVVQNHVRKKTFVKPLNLANGCAESHLLA